MNTILQQISNNPIIGLSGWLATMVALVLAIVIPVIQRKRKELSFKYETSLLVTNKLSEVDGLNILFKGEPVEQLAVTVVEISNNGNRTIEKSDVYKGHELQIQSLNSASILFAKLISQSTDTIECSPVLKEGIVYIDFQTFEKKDSVTINVYHTGSKKSSFDLKGRIKEGKITNFSSDKAKIKKFAISKLTTALAAVTGVMIGIVSEHPGEYRLIISYLFLGILICILVTAAYSFWYYKKRIKQ